MLDEFRFKELTLFHNEILFPLMCWCLCSKFLYYSFLKPRELLLYQKFVRMSFLKLVISKRLLVIDASFMLRINCAKEDIINRLTTFAFKIAVIFFRFAIICDWLLFWLHTRKEMVLFDNHVFFLRCFDNNATISLYHT